MKKNYDFFERIAYPGKTSTPHPSQPFLDSLSTMMYNRVSFGGSLW